MGRPREFDVDEALAQITDVFWAKGFEGASMSDLMAATGLRKGSLYAAFGDKRAMYLKALAFYDRTAIDAGVGVLGGTAAPKHRIDRFLQSAIDAVDRDGDRRGCFLCNASIDQAALNSETEQTVKQSLGRLRRALEGVLAELGTTKSGRRRSAAQHLLSVYFGLRVLAKAGQPVKALRDAKEEALRCSLSVV